MTSQQPIATSKVAQMAFAQLELDPPSSYADDSPQAMDAARFYAEALDGVIEGTDWSFASRVVALAEATLPGTEPDPALPHVYVLPSDLLALREVGEADTAWRRDLHILRADRPARLPLRYTARLDDESRLPAAVRKLVAVSLALLMGPRWLGSPEKLQALRRDHDDLLISARREDSRQASSQPWAIPDGSTVWWAAKAVR